MRILFVINSFLRDFVKSSYGFIIFVILKLCELLKYGICKVRYEKSLNNTSVFILANGPSLKTELTQLSLDDTFRTSPKLVLNYFVFADLYRMLKPKYYCLADPDFFRSTTSEKDKETFYKINSDTTWDMVLFVPCNGRSIIMKYITNQHIKVIQISSLAFDGFHFLKYPLYKTGLAVPSFVNVTVMAEFLLLNMGYDDIRLYGVDHTFFDGLTINEDNVPCFIDKHFNEVELRPLLKGNGDHFTIAEWLLDKYLTFKEHENMRGYADYLGARIVNCTSNSLIDAYDRLSQIEKKEKNDKS